MRCGPYLATLLCASLSLAAPYGVAADTGARLADAAQQQDKAAVQRLLEQRVDVNAAQPDGATALHWAAHWDDLDTVKRLLRAGANPNVANTYGVTPLALAAENGSAAVAETLVIAGANPNAARTTGETPLMTAAWTGSLPVVELLLARGADVNAAESSYGQTPLMWALSERHPDVVRVLVERGADLRARSKGGFTPLLFAAREGDLDSARLLLQKGASANESVAQGPSALLMATVRGHVDVALFLLEKGADPNADGTGFTALHWAAGRFESEVTGKNGIVAPSPDHEWSTLAGIRTGKLDLVKALLAHGADPNLRLVKEPARIGFTRGSLEMRRLIGATPFYLAADAGEVGVMRALVAAGADPLLKTLPDKPAGQSGRVPGGHMTPLMAAAGVGRVIRESSVTEEMTLEAAKFALELGNDINAVNEYGETALHGAAHVRNNALVQYLVDKGADLNVKTTKPINNWEPAGQTPLAYAERHQQFMGAPVPERTSTGDLLRSLGATK